MSGLVLSCAADQIHHYFIEAIVRKLRRLLFARGWQTAFAGAIDDLKRHEIATPVHVKGLNQYLRFFDEMVHWTPRENGDSRLVHDKLVEFYFFLDHAPLKVLQLPRQPALADATQGA